MTFEDTLLLVWRQSLIENSKIIVLDGKSLLVAKTSKLRLKQVEFQFESRKLRAIEQNPLTKSRWAVLARRGRKVMQFIENGSYVAVVVDGKVHRYKR